MSNQPSQYIRQQNQLQHAIASRPPRAKRHTAYSSIVAPSPDLLLEASMDEGSLCVTDLTTGQCVAECELMQPGAPAGSQPDSSAFEQAHTLAWSPDMRTIAFLDRSSREASPGQPKPQLRMVAWSAEQRQLTLQHTVQLPCSAGREPRRYVVGWARDSSQLAVHVPEEGPTPGSAWVITSQGEITFCHGGIAFAQHGFGLAPAARGSDGGMFAVQLTNAFLSKVQSLPEAGSCHLFGSTELADMAWVPATDSSSSLLILLSSDLLVIIDCAASPVPDRVAQHKFQAGSAVCMAASLSHVAVVLKSSAQRSTSLHLLRMRAGPRLEQVAEFPLRGNGDFLQPLAVRFSASGSLLAVVNDTGAAGMGGDRSLAIYSVVRRERLAYYRLQAHCSGAWDLHQLRWSACGSRMRFVFLPGGLSRAVKVLSLQLGV